MSLVYIVHIGSIKPENCVGAGLLHYSHVLFFNSLRSVCPIVKLPHIYKILKCLIEFLNSIAKNDDVVTVASHGPGVVVVVHDDQDDYRVCSSCCSLMRFNLVFIRHEFNWDELVILLPFSRPAHTVWPSDQNYRVLMPLKTVEA